MRLANLLFVATLLAAETPSLPEPYQSIAELARAAPPEFAADGLLRLVESGKIADRKALLDLADQAFHLAANAKFRVRMRALPGSATDTRSGFLSKAYDLKLDALSLQTRAVRDILPVDKTKARELYLEIPKPALAPLSCDDALVHDVADFYETLGAVVNLTFSAPERHKEEHVALVIDYVGQANSPAQFAPLARVIKSVSVTPEQREILWVKFNGLLENTQPDDRSFSAYLTEVSRELTAGNARSLDIYKQRSLGCTDDTHTIATFRSEQEAKPGITPRIEPYWQSPVAHLLLEAAKALRFSAQGTTLTDSDRSSREWQQRLTDFLSRMADWSATQEKTEADYYHQKCVVYEALVEMVPQGPERDEILNAYIHFINNSSLIAESPVEWFMHAHSMLERVRATNTGEPEKLLEAFQVSGNRALSLYAALEKAFTGSIPSWVTKPR